MNNQVIPDEAVEAAAWALDLQTMGSGGALAGKFKEQTRAEARHILEAAAPHLMAAAWDEGYECAVDAYDGRNVSNPYRKPTDV